MSSYKISIVTPFHNIRSQIFRVGFESLKNQTIGFENIEWIIIFHNCEEKYITDAKELVDGYSNIRIDILNDDNHTPSSPRNFGMKLATSKYLGFLDGDDSFTPWCLETALSHMEKSGAEITWFRREYELENENTFPMTEIVLWDQTQSEIIIDKDVNWDDEKLFSGVWGLVTSRIYDRQFLLDNDIWFDNEANFAEDYLFNLAAYGKVKRLCYLPQMIGYHYFINSESLVQKNEKDEQSLIQMAVGFTHIFDTGLKHGFYMDAIMGGMFFSITRFMMGTPSLTLEARIKIKQILEPYLEIMKPIRVSKLYSEKAVNDRYFMVKDYLLNPEKWANGNDDVIAPASEDEYSEPKDMKLLSNILNENMNTDIGVRYDFRNIYTLSAFQERVPVTELSDYIPLINLTTRIGESGIFVKEAVTNYVHMYNSSDDMVIIPVTNSHIAAYVKEMKKLLKNNTTFLLYEGVSSIRKFNDNTQTNSIYGAIFKELFTGILNGKGKKLEITAPYEMLFESEFDYSGYLRILYGVTNENVTQIMAPNIWCLIRKLGYITHMIDTLCDDIENGTILGEKSYQNFVNKKNPKRAEYLRELSKTGNMQLKNLWPKLSRIYAYGGTNQKIYTEKLSNFCEGIELFDGMIMLPEVLLSVASDHNAPYKLYRNTAFYEFANVSYDGTVSDELIAVNDVIEGQTYKVYVTNQSGLYRFNTDRLIKVIKIIDDEIYFDTTDYYRENEFFKDVKINVMDVMDMVKKMGEVTRLPIFDFSFTKQKNRLKIYLEPESEAAFAKANIGELSNIADEIIARGNIAYSNARKSGDIDTPIIKILGQGSMFMFAESRSMRFHITSDSIVPPHHIRSDEIEKMFDAMSIL